LHNLFLQLMGNIALSGADGAPTNFAAELTGILILSGILMLSDLSARPRKGPTAMEDPIQALVGPLNNSDLSLTDLHDLHQLADLLASTDSENSLPSGRVGEVLAGSGPGTDT
jgi:hypothetical protein